MKARIRGSIYCPKCGYLMFISDVNTDVKCFNPECELNEVAFKSYVELERVEHD
ncbi:MAG: hypothetical protein ABID54_14920 [Pseudomonadota bacterium]